MMRDGTQKTLKGRLLMMGSTVNRCYFPRCHNQSSVVCIAPPALFL